MFNLRMKLTISYPKMKFFVKCGIIYIGILVPGERIGTVERTLKLKEE